MESKSEEIVRLQREIAERQGRLQWLVLGDPFKSVSGSVVQSYPPCASESQGMSEGGVG